jgi:hypothetical protein
MSGIFNANPVHAFPSVKETGIDWCPVNKVIVRESLQ